MHNRNKKKLLIIFYLLLIMSGIITGVSLSLLSHNITDPSLFYATSASVSVSNACGVIGAQCSALLLYCFGGAAFLVMIPLLFMAYSIWHERLVRKEWERIIAALCVVLFGAIALAIHSIDCAVSPYPGGVVGLICAQWLLVWCDGVGQVLFVVMSLTAS